MIGIAAAAFIAIFFFRVPFPLIILAAGITGYFGGRSGSPLVGGGHRAGSGPILKDEDSLLGEETPAHARPNLSWSLHVSAVFFAIWLVRLMLLTAFPGVDNVFTQTGLFFSQMAVVTFGGAYAVLAYVAQEAVQHYGQASCSTASAWLRRRRGR